MMGTCGKFLKSILNFNVTQCARPYSVYPKNYVNSIFNKEECDEYVNQLDAKKIDALRVKPSKSDETCSAYYDGAVRHFMRTLIRDGNKLLARRLIEETFVKIKRIQIPKYLSAKEDKKSTVIIDPAEIFHKAVANCTPRLTTKKVIRGGTVYRVPTMINPKRANFLALKYIKEAASNKSKNERFTTLLANELISASENKGKAIGMKNELHKLCVNNQAYAHYRWS